MSRMTTSEIQVIVTAIIIEKYNTDGKEEQNGIEWITFNNLIGKYMFIIKLLSNRQATSCGAKIIIAPTNTESIKHNFHAAFRSALSVDSELRNTTV